MLAAHPEEAVSALFDAQGRTGTWSAALHDVLAADAQTFGMTGPVNVVLPRPGSSWPGALRDGQVAIDGILLGPRDETAMLVIAVGSCRWRKVRSSPSSPRTFRSSGDRASIPASVSTPCRGQRAG